MTAASTQPDNPSHDHGRAGELSGFVAQNISECHPPFSRGVSVDDVLRSLWGKPQSTPFRLVPKNWAKLNKNLGKTEGKSFTIRLGIIERETLCPSN
jgi:hypothetical protein